MFAEWNKDKNVFVLGVFYAAPANFIPKNHFVNTEKGSFYMKEVETKKEEI